MDIQDPALASNISNALGEKQKEQIQQVIKVMGPQFAVSLYEKTLETIAEGGLLRNDGTQRTNGGIYFYLLREYATDEQRREIFREKDRLHSRKKRKKRILLKKFNGMTLGTNR